MFIHDQYLFNESLNSAYLKAMEDIYFENPESHFAYADTLWTLIVGA